MEIDTEKVDEITLALLVQRQTRTTGHGRAMADVLDSLHKSGYMHDPATKAKSVRLTEEVTERSKRVNYPVTFVLRTSPSHS